MSDSEDGTDEANAAADGTDGAASDGDEVDGGDGFDEEAERERLREKYERDKQRREATQKMSELLLQGATMTNRHCEECGSPIFRYDGEEFCPSCGGTTDVDRDAGTDEATTAEGGAAETTEASATEATRSDAGRDDAGQADTGRGDAGRDGAPADRRRASDGPGRRSRTRDAADRPTSLDPERSVRPDPSELQASTDGPTAEDVTARNRGPSGGLPQGADEAPSLAQARASLRRAIVSLSEQAAQSDDPVRAKNLLEAANEGAEALAELGGDEV